MYFNYFTIYSWCSCNVPKVDSCQHGYTCQRNLRLCCYYWESFSTRWRMVANGRRGGNPIRSGCDLVLCFFTNWHVLTRRSWVLHFNNIFVFCNVFVNVVMYGRKTFCGGRRGIRLRPWRLLGNLREIPFHNNHLFYRCFTYTYTFTTHVFLSSVSNECSKTVILNRYGEYGILKNSVWCTLFVILLKNEVKYHCINNT